MATFTIDQAALDAAKAAAASTNLSGINFGMLDMLELWAEREWAKKEQGLPSEWNQGTWMTYQGEQYTGTACGTACCLAGKAVSITPGAQMLSYVSDSGWHDDAIYNPITNFASEHNGETYSIDYAILPDSLLTDNVIPYVVNTPDGKEIKRLGIGEAGRVVLGLNLREANLLFDGVNKLDDVKRVIAEIKTGAYRRVKVDVTMVARCVVEADDYVAALLPGSSTRWGQCVLAEHDDTVQHLFSDD